MLTVEIYDQVSVVAAMNLSVVATNLMELPASDDCIGRFNDRTWKHDEPELIELL